MGNWKMHMLREEAYALITGIIHGSTASANVDRVICPPFPYIEKAVLMTRNASIEVGAQNVHHEERGAYTGEVSAPMLQSLGCKYVIIGHSERRAYSGERNADTNRKMVASLRHGLSPVLCIGETLQQRNDGMTGEVLNEQLVYALQGIESAYISRIIVAYEPVWAIGTGRSAQSFQVVDVHRFIRDVISKFAQQGTGDRIRIIYGGSVNPANATDLLSKEDVDGALIGGASLQAKSFCDIIGIAESMEERVAQCR
jgi:triosephosphate isomerase